MSPPRRQSVEKMLKVLLTQIITLHCGKRVSLLVRRGVAKPSGGLAELVPPINLLPCLTVAGLIDTALRACGWSRACLVAASSDCWFPALRDVNAQSHLVVAELMDLDNCLQLVQR